MANVLIVLTSHPSLGTTGRVTGYYFDEMAAPYYSLIDAGHDVHIDPSQAAVQSLILHPLMMIQPSVQHLWCGSLKIKPRWQSWMTRRQLAMLTPKPTMGFS